jgi:antitoxin Phd
MPTILPVSDLRNYTEVLKICHGGEPVFLTKNGRGKYVLMEMEEYERQKEMILLLSQQDNKHEHVTTPENPVASSGQ